MTAPNNPSQAVTPKDNGPNPEAPPAYTPPRRIPDLAAYIAQNMSSFHYQHLVPQPGEQQFLMESVDSDEPTDTEGSTPIHLRINASINVNRNNNIVCLETTPAENANSIAQAVVKAMIDGSAGRCGIPMIDENGAPRPLRIEVDAGMVIEGENNIVGGRLAISEIVSRRSAPTSLRRRREDDVEDQGHEFQLAKRRRSSQ